MANGWTLERRARQAELIRQWRPWEKSTGPKTEAGKRVTSQNAYKGGVEPLWRALVSAVRVAAHDERLGYLALEYVYRNHEQQQEYVQELRKGYKPERARTSSNLPPPWSTLAAEPAGAECGPDRLLDGLTSYLIKVGRQYPTLLFGLIVRALQLEEEEAPPTVFHLYIKNGHSTKLIFSSGSEPPPASKSPL